MSVHSRVYTEHIRIACLSSMSMQPADPLELESSQIHRESPDGKVDTIPLEEKQSNVQWTGSNLLTVYAYTYTLMHAYPHVYTCIHTYPVFHLFSNFFFVM